MSELWTIAGWLLRIVPGMMFDPSRAGLFWVIVILVAWQYKRAAATEKAIYGELRTPVWLQTTIAAVQGIAGGLVGSLIIVVLGVTLTGAGLPYLLPTALLLMLIHPRLLCFAYAGGILSVLYLMFGVPTVSVPGLMGLVAALHATESLLIFLSGSQYAVGIPLRLRSGRTVGGFSLQKFWPVPIVVLWLTEGLVGANGVAMPEWWPLIRPSIDVVSSSPNLVYSLLPVVAVLGYGDIAISSRPASRTRRTGVWLLLYSVMLMALAVGASRYDLLLWPTALFAPIGHEMVMRIILHREMQGTPWLTSPARGVRVLDTIRGQAAWGLGLYRGDIILDVNGQPVNDRHALHQLLNESQFGAEINVMRGQSQFTVIARRRPRTWGLVAVPEPWEQGAVELRAGGVLSRFIRRLFRRSAKGA